MHTVCDTSVCGVCSAGVGRTGTYIALDVMIDQTEKEREVNFFTTVDNLREDRCHMVQNKVQSLVHCCRLRCCVY